MLTKARERNSEDKKDAHPSSTANFGSDGPLFGDIRMKQSALGTLSTHPMLQGTTRIINPQRAEIPVTWPDTRDLKKIEDLYKIPFSTFLTQLPKGSKILDVGPGRGVLAGDLKQIQNKSFKIEGISTALVDEKHLPSFNTLTYSAVPESKSWLTAHRGYFDFAFDTFASLTYSKNPLHSLIYLLLAIAPNGQFYSMSSMTPGDSENSCFGNRTTQAKIIELFANHFGVDLHFNLVKIQSAACKPGQLMDDLRIHLQVPAQGLRLSNIYNRFTTDKLYKQLCELADREIGVPELMKGKTGFRAGSYHITMRAYKPTGRKAQVFFPDIVDNGDYTPAEYIANRFPKGYYLSPISLWVMDNVTREYIQTIESDYGPAKVIADLEKELRTATLYYYPIPIQKQSIYEKAFEICFHLRKIISDMKNSFSPLQIYKKHVLEEQLAPHLREFNTTYRKKIAEGAQQIVLEKETFDRWRFTGLGKESLELLEIVAPILPEFRQWKSEQPKVAPHPCSQFFKSTAAKPVLAVAALLGSYAVVGFAATATGAAGVAAYYIYWYGAENLKDCTKRYKP